MSNGLFKTSGFTHERNVGSDQNEWLTPPAIVNALGPFDLDPCSPVSRPWDTAQHHFASSGLEREWFGRVWLNPPYGPLINRWLAKMAGHRNGISLIYARTETRMWQELVFPHARLLLFIRGRIWFYTPDGKRAVHGCPAPSVLIAYDEANANALRASGIKGALVEPCGERGAA